MNSEATPPSRPQQQSRTPTVAAQPAQRQSHTLLSSQARPKPTTGKQTQQPIANPQSTVPQTPVTSHVTSPQDDLFNLDFHAPSASAATTSPGSAVAGRPKDIKNDILSLFATSPPPRTGLLGGGIGDSSTNIGTAQLQAQSQPTSMVGSTGTGMWGTQSGWNGMQTAQVQHVQPPLWGQPSQPQQPPQQPFGTFENHPQPQSAGLFTSQNVWGGVGSTAPTQTVGVDLFSAPFSSTTAAQPVKKDDAFGDLWGSFK